MGKRERVKRVFKLTVKSKNTRLCFIILVPLSGAALIVGLVAKYMFIDEEIEHIVYTANATVGSLCASGSGGDIISDNTYSGDIACAMACMAETKCMAVEHIYQMLQNGGVGKCIMHTETCEPRDGDSVLFSVLYNKIADNSTDYLYLPESTAIDNVLTAAIVMTVIGSILPGVFVLTVFSYLFFNVIRRLSMFARGTPLSKTERRRWCPTGEESDEEEEEDANEMTALF